MCLLDFPTAQKRGKVCCPKDDPGKGVPTRALVVKWMKMDSSSVVKPLFQFFSRSFCRGNETETGLRVSLKSSEGAFFSCKGGRLLFSDKSMKPLLPFSIALPLLPSFLKTEPILDVSTHLLLLSSVWLLLLENPPHTHSLGSQPPASSILTVQLPFHKFIHSFMQYLLSNH